jgi:hypothetical protein
MKIVLKDKVYVQINDLGPMMNFMEGKAIPACVINQVFGKFFICCDDNRYEFEVFTQPEAIEFFASLDYSVDYMAVKDMSEEEMINYGVSIAEEKNGIAKKFNAMSKEEKEANQHLVTECEKLDFKMYSVRDILWMRQGHIKMELPYEVRKEEAKKEEKKGLRGFFSRFKR